MTPPTPSQSLPPPAPPLVSEAEAPIVSGPAAPIPATAPNLPQQKPGTAVGKALPNKTASYAKNAMGKKPEDLKSLPSDMFIDKVMRDPKLKDQMPGVSQVLAKFNGNKEEAGAYLRLNKYPSSANYLGATTSVHEAQQAWKANLEKPDLATLRQEMRQSEVKEALRQYRSLGIPPAVAIGRLQGEGKIEWNSQLPLPQEWPPKTERQISPKVKDGWDVVQSQKTRDAEKVKLEKLPLPKKKGEANLRVEAFEKQSQRLGYYRQWASEMKKKGWTKDQSDAVLAKFSENMKATDPAQVFACLFSGSQDSPQAKIPSIKGQAIRFDRPLPAFDKSAVFDSLTAAAISVHQDKVPATPELRAQQGGASEQPMPATNAAVKPQEAKEVSEGKGKDNKFLKRWDELDAEAGRVTDRAFQKMGLESEEKSKTAPASSQAWKIPGASSIADEEPKMMEAKSMERNRMRQIGFDDPEIAGYQQNSGKRSLEQVQSSFSPPKGKDTWMTVGAAQRSVALEKFRGELKAQQSALDGEAVRMQTMGFTQAEAKEYQRQNSQRSKEQVDRSFPRTYVGGMPIPQKDLETQVGKVRADMRKRLVDESAEALQKIDPKLSKENAGLMAAQLYRERIGVASKDEGRNLDEMLNQRSKVQDDLRLISENPKERIATLKDRTATREVLSYYRNGETLAAQDKALAKFYGDSPGGNENLELLALSRKIDMGDPAQVKRFREGLNKETLENFHQTYAEAPKGSAENLQRKKLKGELAQARNAGAAGEEPSMKGMSQKEKSLKKWELHMQKLQQDWKTASENKQRDWQKVDKQQERDFSVKMKKLDFKQQLKQLLLQHELQKEQATHQAVLNLGVNTLGKILDGLMGSLAKRTEVMGEVLARLVQQGAPPSGRDIVLNIGGRGGRASAAA